MTHFPVYFRWFASRPPRDLNKTVCWDEDVIMWATDLTKTNDKSRRLPLGGFVYRSNRLNAMTTKSLTEFCCLRRRPAGECPGFFIGKARPKGWRVGFLGAANPFPSARGTGERCKLLQGAGFGAETRLPKGFSTIISSQDGLCWHYNIVNMVWYGMV